VWSTPIEGFSARLLCNMYENTCACIRSPFTRSEPYPYLGLWEYPVQFQHVSVLSTFTQNLSSAVTPLRGRPINLPTRKSRDLRAGERNCNSGTSGWGWR
jgi:hypothetical protein